MIQKLLILLVGQFGLQTVLDEVQFFMVTSTVTPQEVMDRSNSYGHGANKVTLVKALRDICKDKDPLYSAGLKMSKEWVEDHFDFDGPWVGFKR